MELTFLGTSAGIPTRSRNVTAILFKPGDRGSERWLFDCGEGTQHQLLHTSSHPGNIRKIFISHLHGDHIFGLPGLLCSRSMAGCAAPITLYGPKGLREYVETCLRLSGSWTDYPLDIHEVSPGQIFDDGELRVSAARLVHPVECYGWRIEQHDRPGTIDARGLAAAGVQPGPLFQKLKKGERIRLEDGRMIDGRDWLGPPHRGKTIAIFGDTAPAPEALTLANGADLIVHEATLEHALAEKANGRGHSTSRQAAALARDAGADRLIITHISSRYSSEGAATLLAESRALFPYTELAEDFYSVTV
ncbi:ribonuclease Z [Erwinia sp. CPCC 100877]|nr:ribonuclease Z [Erwinia sp. CPCC 100877]